MFRSWLEVFHLSPWLLNVIQILLLLLGAWMLRTFVLGRLRRWSARTQTDLDDRAVALLEQFLTPLLILAVVAISLNLFELPPRLLAVLNRGTYLVALGVALYYGAKLLLLFLSHWIALSPGRESLRQPVTLLTRVAFMALGVMIIADNLGISLTALWTTLGVGSVAVALALQDTLSNFFAGLYVRLDSPVRVGDYVKLDTGDEGFVTDLGWRSSRIRTLPNNIIVVPNATLASSVITNYSMPDPAMSLLIRVSVSYDADPARVERILVDEVSGAVGKIKGLLGEPAPFVRFIPGFGDSSLDFTLICRVATFVDQYVVQHELRKLIFARLRREGIEIPFPQRDVHIYAENMTSMPAVKWEGREQPRN